MKIKKIRWNRIITSSVFASFSLPMTFLVLRIISAPSEPVGGDEKVKSDYIFLLSQCVIGVLCMLLPGILAKRIKIRIPSGTYLVYVLFLYCTIFLGEVRDFYYSVPHWDTIMHTLSGIMVGALGFSVLSLLNRDRHVTMSLSPLLVALFAFCFAVTVGVVWEIFEFSVDSAVGTNMQKFALRDGTQLLGHAALVDTMKDLTVDMLGALGTSTFGYVLLKFKHGKYERLFDIIEPEDSPESMKKR